MKSIKKSFLFILMALSVLFVCSCQQTVTKLDKPTNLSYDENYVLTWDAVENATEYTVLIGTKTVTVNETSVDISSYLTDGKNNVWVSAVSSNTKFSTSDGASIVVTYNPFTSASLANQITDQFVNGMSEHRDYFETEEQYLEYCHTLAADALETLESLCAGVSVTPEQVVALNSVNVMIQKTPTVEQVFGVVNEIKEAEIAYNDLAKITYNGICLAYSNQDSSTSFDFGTTDTPSFDPSMILSIFASNEKLTVDTFTVIYEYLFESLDDFEEAYNKYIASNKELTDMHALYLATVNAFLGENRPRVDSFNTLVSFIKQSVNMIMSSPDATLAAKLIPDALDLVLAVIDPYLDIIYKSATILSEEELQSAITIGFQIYGAISSVIPQPIIDENTGETIGMSPSVEEVATAITQLKECLVELQTLVTSVSSKLDVTAELNVITAAVEKFVSSESFQTIVNCYVEMVIGTFVPSATPEEVKQIIANIKDIVNAFDPETQTIEELLTSVLATMGLTIDDVVTMAIDYALEQALATIETPEDAIEVAEVIEQVVSMIESLQDPETKVIYIATVLSIIPEEYQPIVDAVFPEGVDPNATIPGEIVETVKEIMGLFINKLNEKVETLSDHIEKQYIGCWNYVYSEEVSAPYHYIEITAHSMYFNGIRATNVVYSGSDYYGYTLFIEGEEYYLTIWSAGTENERLILGSQSMSNTVDFVKEQVVEPNPTTGIPAEYQGTFTGTFNETEYVVFITEESITVNGKGYEITDFDDYEGFTGLIEGETWYIGLGYGEGQIMVCNSDYSIYVTCSIQTSSPEPKPEQLIPTAFIGTYQGQLNDGNSYTVVISESTITINGNEMTNLVKDFEELIGTANGVEYSISFSYGDGVIFVMTSDYTVRGQLTIVAE